MHPPVSFKNRPVNFTADSVADVWYLPTTGRWYWSPHSGKQVRGEFLPFIALVLVVSNQGHVLEHEYVHVILWWLQDDRWGDHEWEDPYFMTGKKNRWYWPGTKASQP